MSRDGREPFIGYVAAGGYRDTGFTVAPMSLVRLGQGHYVLIPVLSEREGDELIKRLRNQP